MKYNHGHHTLSTLAKTLTTKDDAHFIAYIEVMSVLGKFWSARFTPSEFLVLSFLANRTLIFRKRAESITRKHFDDGVSSERGDTCTGCGVSEHARVRALNSLCSRNFINVHCFLEGKTETKPRIYELNYELLVEGHDLGEIRNMLKRSRTATRDARIEDDFYAENTPRQSSGAPLDNRGGITELLHSSKNTSINIEESAASQPNHPALKVGKKSSGCAINVTTTKAPLTGNAQERVAQILESTTRVREARVATTRTLPARRWDMKELQALLDTARAEAGVSVPRVMATSKGAGVLFKRMKDAEVKDTLEFFTWAFKNWGTVANANRRSKATQMKNTKTVSTEMSMIPNFSELAYRFPYILVFFNERKYTQVQTQERAVEQKAQAGKVVDAQQQAIDLRRELAREQDLANRERERAAPVVNRVRRTRPAVALGDDEIPEFKEREWVGK